MCDTDSLSKQEAAIFTIILDQQSFLFDAGTTVTGHVFIHFHGTREEITFETLIIYLKENINLPERKDCKKNLTSQVFDKKTLLSRSFNCYDDYILDINQSNIAKIPFIINIPDELASSFNSKQLSISYEIKVELLQLKLCGELCDLSTSQPIEVKEHCSISLSNNKPDNQVGSYILHKALQSKFGMFSVLINKLKFHKDERIETEVSMKPKVKVTKALLKIDIVQQIELKDHSTWETIIYKTKQLFYIKESKHASIKCSIPLNDFTFASQPTVQRSDFIVVTYLMRVTLNLTNNKQLTLEHPFKIERKNSIFYDNKRVLSKNNVPLLPLNLTVNELKTDGLQTYIPLKQSYENKRLTVKKGNLNSVNAVLTIVTESCKPYTKQDTIKGYVYFRINDDIIGQVTFDHFFIILVGVQKLPSTNKSSKGEMFLFERKVLRGSTNHISGISNSVKSTSNTVSRSSGMLIIEFEFNLDEIKTQLPPSFRSADASISYEIKADLRNFRIDGTCTSLYTTLPIVIKEEKVTPIICNVSTTSVTKTYTLSGKELDVVFSIDKNSYTHQDAIQISVNIKNKSKCQLTVKVELSQAVEYVDSSTSLTKAVCNPIIILVLPRSKLETVELMHLKDILFHRQPTISQYSKLNVSYYLTLQIFVSSGRQISLKKLTLPIKILRRYGHSCKSITREGYPLLPLTIEIVGKEKTVRLPPYLTEYSEHNLIQYLHCFTYDQRWKGWIFKA